MIFAHFLETTFTPLQFIDMNWSLRTTLKARWLWVSPAELLLSKIRK